MPRKRNKPTPKEQAVGLAGPASRVGGVALDYLQNMAARTGLGTPNLISGTEYPLVRFTYNYWELITLYEEHWLCRRIVDTPAEDMIRTWPRLISSDLDPKDLGRLDRALRRTRVRQDVLTTLKWARLFGGAGALIVIKGHENNLDEPLDLDSVELGAFQGLLPFDRWAGIQPEGEPSVDFSRPQDFNLPERYTVTASGGDSYKVHASRVLRFTGYTNPTPEREAYSWWGISVLEPAIEEIKKYDNMNWNVALLTFRANLLGYKEPELAQIISGVGMSKGAATQWERRMTAINHLVSNQSMIPLGKDGDLVSVQYTFAGLAEVMMNQQLVVSGAAQMPVARLWGRTYSGLGQTGDGDEKIYEERIATDNETQVRPQLEKLYPVLCMSELGEVPEDLDLNFPSVRVLDEKEKSEMAKTVVDAVAVCVNTGFMSKRTAATELKESAEVTGFGTNLTDEEIAALPDKAEDEGEIGAGLFGEEEGEPVLEPASGPQRVLREEGRAKKAEGRAADSDGPGRAARVGPFDVVVETPRGGVRRGDGWQATMAADYGYLVGYEGADGDSLDCYVGPSPESSMVYVVDQYRLDKPRHYDESKVMLGFNTRNQALDAYMASHHRSGRVFAAITPMTMDGFRSWLGSADLRRPCSSKVRA